MKSRKVIGAVAIAVGIILAAALIGLNIVQANKRTNIYVMAKDVVAGAIITEDDVETESILTSDKKKDYIVKAEDVVGKTPLVNMSQGDIIRSGKISEYAENTDNQFLNIPDGKEVISFAIKGGSDSLSNKLKVGDIIRIYSNGSRPIETETTEALKYVRVASITTSGYQDVTDNGNDGVNTASKEDAATATKAASYDTITVIVSSFQAQQIIKLQNRHGIYVTLLSRGDDARADKMLKAQDEIVARLEKTAQEGVQ